MGDQLWRGTWWIAGEDAEPQLGTLSISPTGKIKLDLIGGFDLSVQSPIEGGVAISALDRRPPLVYGLCASKKITLVDCQTSHLTGAFIGIPDYHQLTAGRALVGTHLSDVDAPEFLEAQFRIENLLSWLQISGLEQRIDVDGESASAHILRSEPLKAAVDGWEVEAWVWSKGFRFEQHRNTASVVGEIEAYLTVKPDHPVSYRGFDDIAKALMDLITLASGEASGMIGSTLVHVDTTEIRVGPGSSDVRDMPISVDSFGQYVHKSRPDDAPQTAHRFRFTCATASFSDLVALWIPLRLRALGGCNVRFGLEYSRPGFTETRLLSIAVAAEAFHRDIYGDPARMEKQKFRKLKDTALGALQDPVERGWLNDHLHNDGETYRNRLLDLVERPASIAVDLIIHNKAKWADDLVRARNGLAHSAGTNAKTIDIFALTETTIFLLDLVLMHELGLSEDTQVVAARSNEFLSSLQWKTTRTASLSDGEE